MKAIGIFGATFVALIFQTQITRANLLSPSVFSGQKQNKVIYDEKPLAFSQIINASFTNSSFILNHWQQISVKNSSWVKSKLVGTKIVSSSIEDVQFFESDLSGIKCFHCQIKNAKFENVKLDGARFFNSQFENVDFTNVQFSRTDFIASTFKNCSMDSRSAKLLPADFIKKSKIVIRSSP
ncbi:pentapeptide repeat-containing protein [Bdellovibrio reynosensis]|uniref:Pentapeptide repeat-containing protein n=1 Tax=Bdellovibrio reynosensis TaxID=2835041 RepID=A0ABY4CFZ5_9BACT|nr:pentapeptide repeat-containing protein [Bdellovibrio reynosensis]UOF02473.1 pentapeptide repeat-containing protein [Bdellovibrio reynosensis]